MKFEEESFIGLRIIEKEIEIGKAVVGLHNHRLSNFEIYPPFRNKGYGQKALSEIIEKYSITNLCVEFDNEVAMYIYKKCGFYEAEPKFLEMERI